MLELTTTKWVRYEPSLPGNREAPAADRFYLEVLAGMSVERFEALQEAGPDGEDAAARRARVIRQLEGCVRLGSTTCSLDGAPMTTVGDYLGVILQQAGLPLYGELLRELARLNSWEGARAVFCGPPSGSSAGTLAPASGQAAKTTGG